jgi:hypothetical protein
MLSSSALQGGLAGAGAVLLFKARKPPVTVTTKRSIFICSQSACSATSCSRKDCAILLECPTGVRFASWRTSLDLPLVFTRPSRWASTNPSPDSGDSPACSASTRGYVLGGAEGTSPTGSLSSGSPFDSSLVSALGVRGRRSPRCRPSGIGVAHRMAIPIVICRGPRRDYSRRLTTGSSEIQDPREIVSDSQADTDSVCGRRSYNGGNQMG